VAKAYLDAAIGKQKRRLPNDAMGHRQLIHWIKQIEGEVQVICEPSGGYERGVDPGAGWCASQSQFGPSQPGTAVCQSGGHFGQDRFNRCRGAMRLWTSHAAANPQRIEAATGALARTGESAPAF
jgi:hypothetical protein